MIAHLPLKQGRMDGLCGLYAIMNFCLERKVFEKSVKKEAEWYVFEAAEMEGLLTTYYLYTGFEVQHIFAIFRRLCENLRLPYKPMYLDELAGNAYDAVELAMTHGGGVVCGFENSRHWILVHGKNVSGFAVHDSAATGLPVTKIGQAKAKKLSLEAIALMPEKFVKES